MNIAPAASVAHVQTADGVSVAMLRKVLDMQQANAAQLIASLPAAPQALALVDRGGQIGKVVVAVDRGVPPSSRA